MKIPFDIKFRPQIESGEYKVETRDGKKVRVLCYDANNTMPVVALVTFNNGSEGPIVCCSNGTIISNEETPIDLFLVTPEPELSEFEKACMKLYNEGRDDGLSGDKLSNESVKESASELLAIARAEIFANDAVLKEFAEISKEQGKAEALRTRATELTENLSKSGLDKDSIPYHLIEFMCNLYTCQNWKEIEEIAEAYDTRIKAAAIKDLPRWRRDKSFETEGTFMGVKGRECFVVKDGYSISVAELIKKLTGFNE